ncbi:amino acid decarboxylase [Mycolicibacter engbaekii]|uniref:Amino acid decarboxylase n=1 Tax=Mycolicibacter engbaekii TaxID=188915 RepID=A0A1X1TZ91_9MYCO|nr:aminotransferase class I/II-fold pyridoxal phosphate-dependent enzyme [Mycolicibacter engbaekii]ORV49877.1 amino acid decarboxylase [Mycolicibacter engbaekii]
MVEGWDAPNRRLRVSALAAVANPSYSRVDTWNLLDDACRQLAEANRAGLDTAHHAARVKRLLDRLGAYERYWLFPGAANLAVFRDHLASLATVSLTERVSLVVRLLSDYGDRAALFDLGLPLSEQELVAQARQQQFYTVLLADDSPPDAPESLADNLRRLRNPDDDVQIELLVVSSVEDAVTAVALNGEIQAAIVRHDLPLRSRDRVPLMTTLLGAQDDAVGAGGGRDAIECGEWMRLLRPHIDLYLLTDESIAADTEDEPDVYDRSFYRLNDVTDLHSTVLAGIRKRYATPFFDALRAYAAEPVGQFHALPVARGASIFNSRTLQDMGEFYGRNIFMAETSSTSGGLDSLLDPHGTIRVAMNKAAKTWNADHTYFVTNGTSTANKIVVQALTRPGDIVLIDRNCHKSHHYGLVLAGAYPLYLDAYPLAPFAIYGAVALRTIKRALLDLEAAGQLHRVRMLLLTNCTFDGVVYNPRRVMEEILAIKPDICFLWDEAWYAFATAVPWARQRTAMVAAEGLEATLGSAHYAREYQAWHDRMEGIDRDQWSEHRLLPHPSARVRVYATHSTHKSLSALRQASMIHIRDQDFNALARESFAEAFLTHTSTSPNQQLLASLDLARRQVDIEGFDMVRRVYDMALVFRHRVRKDRLIGKWFHILDESDLVPDRFRESAVSSYREVRQGALGSWNEAWRSDEFVLDPTRVTLYVGKTGMTGYDFREKVLMQRFGIQINKTSINSVLLIFTIGVTWSSVHYLLDALRRVAGELDRAWTTAGADDRALQRRRVTEITEDLPPLPDFSAFAPAFRPGGTSSPIGDMRAAFYDGYEEADREHVLLGDAGRRVADGKTLVSTTFVVPYPPGFPVLVPGQVISKEILYFLAELDVKEIHGYNPELGLAVFTQDALDRYTRAVQAGA